MGRIALWAPWAKIRGVRHDGRWQDHFGKKLEELQCSHNGGVMSQRKAEFQNRGRRLLRRRFY